VLVQLVIAAIATAPPGGIPSPEAGRSGRACALGLRPRHLGRRQPVLRPPRAGQAGGDGQPAGGHSIAEPRKLAPRYPQAAVDCGCAFFDR